MIRTTLQTKERAAAKAQAEFQARYVPSADTQAEDIYYAGFYLGYRDAILATRKLIQELAAEELSIEERTILREVVTRLAVAVGEE